MSACLGKSAVQDAWWGPKHGTLHAAHTVCMVTPATKRPPCMANNLRRCRFVANLDLSWGKLPKAFLHIWPHGHGVMGCTVWSSFACQT